MVSYEPPAQPRRGGNQEEDRKHDDEGGGDGEHQESPGDAGFIREVLEQVRDGQEGPDDEGQYQQEGTIDDPLDDDGGQRRALVHSFFVAEEECPDQLAQPDRQEVVGHVSDGNDGEEATDRDALHRVEEETPPDGPEEESDEVGQDARDEPPVVGALEGVRGLPEVDLPEEEGQEAGAEDDAEPEPSALQHAALLFRPRLSRARRGTSPV